MRIAFYAPMKPPDHPVPSGDRRMARLLMRALKGAGHAVDVASRLCSHDETGDGERQQRLRARGRRTAAKLIAAWRGPKAAERPEVWVTYYLDPKAPDWLGTEVSAALGIPYVVAEATCAPQHADGPWKTGHDAVARALGAADLVFGFNTANAACVRPCLAARNRLVPLAPFLDSDPYVRAAFAGLKGRVTWLGTRTAQDLAAIYAAGDVYVWPAVHEPYGMAFLEAQAAGLPAVASWTGSVPDIVTDGETGLLAPEGDGAAFAVAMRALMDDESLRGRMADNARRAVLARHSLPAAARFLDARLGALRDGSA